MISRLLVAWSVVTLAALLLAVWSGYVADHVGGHARSRRRSSSGKAGKVSDQVSA